MYKGLQSFYKTTAVICTHAPKALHLERLDEAVPLLLSTSLFEDDAVLLQGFLERGIVNILDYAITLNGLCCGKS